MIDFTNAYLDQSNIQYNGLEVSWDTWEFADFYCKTNTQKVTCEDPAGVKNTY